MVCEFQNHGFRSVPMKRCFLIIAGLLAVLAGPVAAQTPVGVNALVENSVQTRSVGESG